MIAVTVSAWRDTQQQRLPVEAMHGRHSVPLIPLLGLMAWFSEMYKDFTREELGAPIWNLSSLVDNSDPAPATSVTNPLMLVCHLISKCRHTSTGSMTIDEITTSLYQIAYAQLAFKGTASINGNTQHRGLLGNAFRR